MVQDRQPLTGVRFIFAPRPFLVLPAVILDGALFGAAFLTGFLTGFLGVAFFTGFFGAAFLAGFLSAPAVAPGPPFAAAFLAGFLTGFRAGFLQEARPFLSSFTTFSLAGLVGKFSDALMTRSA
ncbi:MAG: hypothetical protein IPN91_13820 [Holophagaceae bacterium]|uniref:Uncharacterized protein n=1 Tax=Candidatus Geothrix odensensis TaxID=2954440 RepID=A0A936F4N6_9BACT|nr:hypothetical protein [Candidatus Geothrix odensensis]